ncbi:MarR family winged helix-turn-helix transcriptional regulator [Cryptosporangium aurantiacum]|uniref:DNA-binding transcriptional regulator, MarR family n=1 Tax=Cryptosporangium aurantiacum TaxID=134849 RepID=A0A1M7R0R4_9ACTN|nr:MarR family transcriptional regulator [Cryptosporangium aurantiacum]SHN38144.1 DNA-binding transcriptional regulator, MarR family [Cryptosporangium aurantiacum]
MTGSHTLRATEQAVEERLAGMSLDTSAMWAVSNIYRATTAIRNHLEQTVLRDTGLTWTGFVVLWVVWIWGEIETAQAAAEAGISKGTLTGVVKTLESYRHIKRERHETDKRRVVLSMTPSGRKLMEGLFPQFNREEAVVVRGLSEAQRKDLANSLRTIVEELEQAPPRGEAVKRPG